MANRTWKLYDKYPSTGKAFEIGKGLGRKHPKAAFEVRPTDEGAELWIKE